MFAPGIIEHLDVVEHVVPCVLSGFVRPATNAFAFEQVEETFRDSVIMTISTAAHAVFKIVVLEKQRPIDAGEL